MIVRLLPVAGVGLITALTAVNVLLGLLPVGFVLATSVLIGRVPAAVVGGVGSPAWHSLVIAFVLAAAAFLAQQVLSPVQGALGIAVKRRVDGELRDQTVSLAMKTTSIGPMEDQTTLDALSGATRQFESDHETPGMACAGILALIARYLRLVGFAVIVGVVASWPAGLALAAATLVFRYGNRGGLRKYSAVWRTVTAERRRMEYLRDLAIGGGAAKETRIFGITPWLTERYSEAYLGMIGPVTRMRRRIYLWPYIVYTSFGFVISTFVAVGIARAAANGQISLTGLALGLQSVIGAILLGEYYIEADIPTQYGMEAVTALEEVRERVAAVHETDPSTGRPVAPDQPRESLRFADISFSYPGSGQRVLDGLTLELPAGLSTAIVGVNGAGKTTLVKLLTRLYEPTAGRITADGEDIATLDVAAWRRQVSVIFQDFVRYDFSAADNIALGAAHAPRDIGAIERAAAQADILTAFDDLPAGLDTPLARAYRGGIDLSGGQWQRIAIARSLYALQAGARVLVLDEPTAALDVRAEVAFFDQFVQLTRGVTSLLISHRFSSVRRADRIVVIDGGRVVERGSHDELMAADGHYARLFGLQAERFAAGLDAEGNKRERAAADDPVAEESS
jgi:ATP-binding cassette subfamily B protein